MLDVRYDCVFAPPGREEMFPVNGARSDVPCSGSSRSSRVAVKVSHYATRLHRQTGSYHAPSSGSIRSRSSASSSYGFAEAVEALGIIAAIVKSLHGRKAG